MSPPRMDWTQIITALIAGVPAIIAAISSKRNNTQLKANTRKLDAVHAATVTGLNGAGA